jgi:histidine triad (HIT) family protein
MALMPVLPVWRSSGRDAWRGPAGRKRRVGMASVFTRIINGELPGRFVWRDDRCVAFLSAHPLKPGHTLVVPREEVDHWIDLDPGLASHLMRVSQSIGRALQYGFKPVKVGVIIAGLEVPHVHLHLVPIEEVHDLNFGRQNTNPDPSELDRAAETIRAALRGLGYTQVS